VPFTIVQRLIIVLGITAMLLVVVSVASAAPLAYEFDFVRAGHRVNYQRVLLTMGAVLVAMAQLLALASLQRK
jgi:hypothetical protein